MPWRSAELLFADDRYDSVGEGFGSLFAISSAKEFAGHRQTSEPGDDGAVSTTRGGSAAFYRCQAPDPDCQCLECWYIAHPKAPRPVLVMHPKPIRIDSEGRRWYKCRLGEINSP